MLRGRVLQVRIDASVVALPAASVQRVWRLQPTDWSGVDAHGGPLRLAATARGPVVVVAAPVLLGTEAVSPHPAWAVVLAGDAEPLLAFAVCDVLGLEYADDAAPAGRLSAR